MNKASRDINSLLDVWELDIDGDKPLKFEDDLSRFFFGQDICRLLNKYYALGKKDEKKRRKQKSAERWRKKMDKAEQ